MFQSASSNNAYASSKSQDRTSNNTLPLLAVQCFTLLAVIMLVLAVKHQDSASSNALSMPAV